MQHRRMLSKHFTSLTLAAAGLMVASSGVTFGAAKGKGKKPATDAPAASAATADASAASTKPAVKVVDGIVQPRRPIMEAVAEAIEFLRKADAGYVPGHIDGPLAGYFLSAHVLEDGTPSSNKTAFPGRQHAYFINTFLLYSRLSGDKQWILRAKDLADWNLAHSTPASDKYASIPWSAWSNGKPGGSQDKDSLEPDKAAFLGTAYLALYDATKEAKYLDGAKTIGQTLAKTQGPDGSWPFRVIPQDGTVKQAFGGAPVFYVDFFQKLMAKNNDPAFKKAYEQSLKLMIDRNIEKNQWGTYHEDIKEKADNYMSAEPMSFTAIYLFRHAKENPAFIEMGKKVISRMEAALVHTEGHPAAPAPAVSEQQGFQHMMPGHTARYCAALTDLYVATGDQEAKKKALSGFNALTFMQSPAGLFRTMFQLVNEKTPKDREDWYSQHLYTVCHVLESIDKLPELKGEKKAG